MRNITRTLTIFAVTIAAGANALSAQTTPALTSRILPAIVETKLAESAAPDSVSTHAGIYVFTDSGYVSTRASANGFTCLVNRDSFLDGYEVLKPTCWDAAGTTTIVPQILYIGKRKAAGANAATIKTELEAKFASGEFTNPAGPGIAYMLAGDIRTLDEQTGAVHQRAFPPHLMLYAAGASLQKLGLSPKAAAADIRAPLVYSPNRRFAYIVVRVPQPEAK